MRYLKLSMNTLKKTMLVNVVSLLVLISGCSSVPSARVVVLQDREAAQKFPRVMLDEGRKLTKQNWEKRILEPFTAQP